MQRLIHVASSASEVDASGRFSSVVSDDMRADRQSDRVTDSPHPKLAACRRHHHAARLLPHIFFPLLRCHDVHRTDDGFIHYHSPPCTICHHMPRRSSLSGSTDSSCLDRALKIEAVSDARPTRSFTFWAVGQSWGRYSQSMAGRIVLP